MLHWGQFDIYSQKQLYIHMCVYIQILFACVVDKAMATHSSTLAWKIPWTEGPGRLQSMGSLGVGHDCATSLSLFTFMHWRRKWQPTPVFMSGESQGWRAWWAAIYGVAQSRIRLKRLSSSSCGQNILFPMIATFHCLEDVNMLPQW